MSMDVTLLVTEDRDVDSHHVFIGTKHPRSGLNVTHETGQLDLAQLIDMIAVLIKGHDQSPGEATVVVQADRRHIESSYWNP